jgi:tetratricopeptide (TPR) repeat protein
MFRRLFGNSDNEEQHAMKGAKHFQAKQYVQAIQECSKAIELGRNNPDVYGLRCLSFLMTGHIRRAFSDINTAISMDDKVGTFYGTRANLWLHCGNLTNAIDDSTIALKLKPGADIAPKLRELRDDWECGVLGLQIVAKQHNNDNSWTTSLDDYMQLVKKRATSNPNLLEIPPLFLMLREIGQDCFLMLSAYDVMRQKKYSKAVDLFTQVLEISPNHSYALLNRGISYLKQRDFSRGLQDFSKAIELDEGFRDPYFFRAIIYRVLKNHSNAKADFAKFVKLGGDVSLVSEEEISRIMSQLAN